MGVWFWGGIFWFISPIFASFVGFPEFQSPRSRIPFGAYLELKEGYFRVFFRLKMFFLLVYGRISESSAIFGEIDMRRRD